MVEFRDATKIYKDNGTIALQNVNLFIEQGEFSFIVGHSGSGKSTLIKLLFREEELTDGQIFVDNINITKLKKREVPYLRRRMGIVFQDFRLLPNKTVYENVAFAMEVVESSHRQIRRDVPMVLSMVGLSSKAKAYPKQLSGGEQQRTALARAIVNKPPLLIADEPTGNLDPDTAWEIMQVLEDINNIGTTVLIATHAWDIVDNMQKRVIRFQHGNLVRDDEESGYSDEDPVY
ncbi:MAG: cell division ATP-binding protein FtsE [Defluviitaleaceae bacterium]|nr:cell division ATP-binding protein FtsE [Defluviitaleaceae bacterium]MCL2835668.1 cell division ATP-binding protein FtsE [Defluviitaleaceae bacterium]